MVLIGDRNAIDWDAIEFLRVFKNTCSNSKVMIMKKTYGEEDVKEIHIDWKINKTNSDIPTSTFISNRSRM